jgi:enamidase
MRTAVVNLGTIVSGDRRRPFVAGGAILMEDGRIATVGNGDMG